MLKISTKGLFVSYFISFLYAIPLLMTDGLGNWAAIPLCLFLIIFLIWVINKLYDFNNKKLNFLSLGDRLTIILFTLPTTMNGPWFWMISIWLLSLALLVQYLVRLSFKTYYYIKNYIKNRNINHNKL